MKIKPIVKVPGAKTQLNSWILDHFPKNYQTMTYIEPFIGGGSILLNKEICVEEVINDKNLNIVNLWRSLRDEGKTFISKLKKIEYKEKEFNLYKNKSPKNYFECSIREFVLIKMSKGGLKETYNAPQNKRIWNSIIEDLEITIDKIKNLIILNKSAHEIIKYFNDENTLIYCDPPHLEPTVKINQQEEMTTDEHIELSDVLNAAQGKIMVSGYNSSLYRKLYAGWKMCKKASSQGKVECLWVNF
jgi:DNA adenine methylase